MGAGLLPPLDPARGHLELSVRLSFRGNGEILGEPFISFETPNVSAGGAVGIPHIGSAGFATLHTVAV